ncbi:MAG TPA: LuxR C-terminal-related transcriptional regulator [Acidimicrobiia bacterium]
MDGNGTKVPFRRAVPGAAGGDALDASDLRHVLALLEDVERAATLDGFRRATLDGLAGHFGLRRSTFFLSEPIRPGVGADTVDGIENGFPPGVLEEYVDRYVAADVFRTPAASVILHRHGYAQLGELLRAGGPDARRYLDDFLLRHHIGAQLSVRLDTRGPKDGVVTILGHDERDVGPREWAVLAALRPHLTNLLVRHLATVPHGVKTANLTSREREVAELVAAGWSNREIASSLFLSEDTVKKHLSGAMAKLRARNRTELALAWVAS